MVAGPVLLNVRGLSKQFPGVKALDDVSLRVRAGEVMALVGENGAGKSTIVKILTGIYKPDAGTIEIAGTPMQFSRPTDAWAAGISAIHQETSVFEDLTVGENIFMGHQPTRGRGPLVDWKDIHRRSAEILDRMDVAISTRSLVRELSVAERHILGVAKALAHDAQIVIMDEPSASLSRKEIDHLMVIVRQLRDEGKGIIFISHKFVEIFEIADRYAVLRDGQLVGEGNVADVTQDELVKLMVGRSVEEVFPKVDVPIGDVVLEVSHLTHDTEFEDISFTLRKGEILGFYGLVGSGRSEVMQSIFGVTRSRSGTLSMHGRPIKISSPSEAMKHGLALVPEDRQQQGAILPLSIRQNMTLALIDQLSPRGFLSRRRELGVTRDMGARLSIKAAHWDQQVDELSGGNQQKVVIGKWLATRPEVMILDEPTKGIDIGSKAAVHEFMGELVAQGLAVILVSSELEEVRGMADRIIVMHEGRICGEFSRDEATAEAIVTVASGAQAGP